MTLVFKNSLYREYVSPGTEEDGYVKPEWQVPIHPRFWQGGRGDWIYNGHVGSDANDDPDVVRMVKIGEDTVRMVRERLPPGSSPAPAR